MKCPECHTFHRKSPAGHICANCQYIFKVDASLWPDWDDSRMLDAVKAVSADGKRHWTEDAFVLHALVIHRKPRLVNRFVYGVLAVILILLGDWFSWGLVPSWWLIFLSFIPFAFVAREFTALNPTTVMKCARGALADWLTAHPELPGIIEQDKPGDPDLGPVAGNRDAFSALLITDDTRTRDWIAANGFTDKFPGVCLISSDAEPHPEIEKVGHRLAGSSTITVYLLHTDAVSGHEVSTKASRLLRFQLGENRVKDLGLNPADTRKLRKRISWHDGPMTIHTFPTDLAFDAINQAMKSGTSIRLKLNSH